MTNSIPNTADDDLLEEYNFSKGIRGKYVDRFKEGSKIVMLSPDVDEVFKNSGCPPRRRGSRKIDSRRGESNQVSVRFNEMRVEIKNSPAKSRGCFLV